MFVYGALINKKRRENGILNHPSLLTICYSFLPSGVYKLQVRNLFLKHKMGNYQLLVSAEKHPYRGSLLITPHHSHTHTQTHTHTHTHTLSQK